MAGRYKYHPSPYPLAITSATSEATGYPKERLASLQRLNRSWRSTSTAEQKIVVDLLAIRDMQTIVLYNSNFTDVALAHDDQPTGPFTPQLGGPWAMAPDLKDGGRYKLISDAEATNRYLEITIPTQTPVDGAAYFRLGAIIVAGPLTELVNNPQRPTTEERLQHSLRATIGADEEVVEVGPSQLQEVWSLRTDSAAEINTWRTLRNLGEANPVVWWYNQQTYDVYLMRYVGGISIQDSDQISEVSATWRQIR